MTQENQRGWPFKRRSDGTEPRSPTAFYLAPAAIERSNRAVAGPLRRGTAPGVGPRANPQIGSSDMGMDRIEQRPVDSIGQKYPEVDPPVQMIARELREQNRRRRE